MNDHSPGEQSAYSVDMRDRILLGLMSSVALRDEGISASMAAIVKDACAETHALGLTTVQMVIALKALYASFPSVSIGTEVQRRVAFDRFLSACIVRWFEDSASTSSR